MLDLYTLLTRFTYKLIVVAFLFSGFRRENSGSHTEQQEHTTATG